MLFCNVLLKGRQRDLEFFHKGLCFSGGKLINCMVFQDHRFFKGARRRASYLPIIFFHNLLITVD